MPEEPLLAANAIALSYGNTPALRGVDLQLRAGDQVALMGASGSGKSSLLHCLAGIIRPYSGSVTFAGERLDTLSEKARSALRLREMGVVFQFGDLVPELTLAENVMLPLQMLGTRTGKARTQALEMLDALGVAEASDRRSGSVAGGQSQRAAVARALIHRPRIVFADEPTGALDTLAAELVMDAIVDMTRELGSALFLITHDHRVAAHLQKQVSMRDGVVHPAAVQVAP